jgi:hypothetical protein
VRWLGREDRIGEPTVVLPPAAVTVTPSPSLAIAAHSESSATRHEGMDERDGIPA